MTQKSKTIIWIFLSILVLLILSLYYLNTRFHIFADIIGKPYDLFAKSPLEPVYTNTVPSSSEIIKSGGQIESFAAQGETEPVTFSVRPYIDLGLVQIDISDLTNGNNKIVKENIDVKNVKIWRQCGPKNPPSGSWLTSCNNPDITMAHNIPELLVKDNEQDFQAEERGWVKADKKYYAPIANNDFRADLKKNITHTFYLSIKTPKDAVAGNYIGTVTFKPQNASQQQFSLKLGVLPFELPESGKEIILHLTQRLADGADSGFADIGREKYDQYLNLVREAGVTSIVLLFTESDISSSADNLNWLAGKIKEKGFHGTLILRGSSLDQSAKIRQNLAILQGKGFDVYVYGKDTPDTTAKMLEGLAISKQIHDAGGKVTTSVKKQCSEDLLDPNCPIYGLSGVTPIEKIDLPIYMIGTSSSDCDFYTPATRPARQLIKEYITGLQNGTVAKNPYKEFYYFQIWSEQMEQAYWTKPSYIRTMTGFFLYKSGLDGIVPYGLDSVFSTHGNKEYDDFDAPLKDYRAVYRTEKGFLKTLQFETFREGIDDIRYMTKLDEMLKKLSLLSKSNEEYKVLAEKIKKEVDAKLAVYTYKGAKNQDPWNVSNATNQSNRRFIANKIIEIQKVIEPESAYYCGDKTCQSNENCSICQTDCGKCQTDQESGISNDESDIDQKNQDQKNDLNEQKKDAEIAKKTSEEAPQPPSGLEAQVSPTFATGLYNVNLMWEPSSSQNISGYNIYKNDNQSTGQYIKIADVDKNNLEYTDKGLEKNSKYFYVVKSFLTNSESKESNVAEIKTGYGNIIVWVFITFIFIIIFLIISTVKKQFLEEET